MRRLLIIAFMALLAGSSMAQETGSAVSQQKKGGAVLDAKTLFTLFYDINAHGTYRYAKKMMARHGFRLLKKWQYSELIDEYVYSYAVPGFSEVEIGWQGAVGFGLHVTTDTEELGSEMAQFAKERGFKSEDDIGLMYSDGFCFVWLRGNSIWMYGRKATTDK